MPKVQDTNEAEYLAAVKEGKAICATMSGKQWALGDLAAQVTKVYGEHRLERFAEDINFPGAACTLERYRSVCLAFPKSGGRPRFFGSAQVLQGHNGRAEIIRKNPNITKRAARELMRQWHEEQGTTTHAEQSDENKDDDTEPNGGGDNNVNSGEKGAKAKGTKREANREQEPDGLRDIRGWFNNQVERVNAVIDELNKVMENCTPEQHNLLTTLEPTLLLEAFRKGTEKSAKFVDWVETPLEKAADRLIGEGRVKITPARRRAAQPVRPEA
jgi:hypothetical protein